MNGKINIGSNEKVTIDGEKVKEKINLETFKGDNPLMLGSAGYTFPAKTLLKDGLQIINGVNGEDLTDTVADQTTAVTELMKMVSRKIAMNNGEGQYVWKKCEYEQVLASEIIVTQIQGGGVDACIIKFSSDKIDFSTIDNSFFVGMKLTYTGPRVVNLYANNVAGFESSTSGHSWTWNPSTQQMSFSFTGSSNVTWAITSPASFGVKNITGYVVSSDESAYPNGGTLDGYWYEFMEEGLIPEMFLGCTKYAVDKFTYTTNQSMGGKTLNHSLGKVPKLAFVSAPDLTTHSLAYETFWLSGSARVYTVNTTSNPTNIFSSAHGIKNVTAAAITLSSDSIYFAAGVEYTIITMA